MRSSDLISMGFRNLWRRKLRTFLTVLGVIIGTASIVIMVSLGFGMTEGFREQLAEIGNLHVITVNRSYDYGGDSRKEKLILDDKAVSTFAGIKGVQAVTPILESYVRITSGKYTTHVSIKGIIPETMEAFDYKLKDGRLLQEEDTLSLVFGSYVPSTFYNPKDRNFWNNWDPERSYVDVLKDRMELTFDTDYYGPNDKKKPPKTYKINGVGILDSGDYENDYYVFMPLSQMKKLMNENRKNSRQQGSGTKQEGYNEVKVKVADINDVQTVQQQIKDMGYSAYSLNDMLESMQETAATLQAVLGGIGAVSLLVAALGITNTMIMSIYERTREIGIMKVIGASLSDIRRLFLLEAGIIGLTGGLIGIALSYGASYILNRSNFSLLGMGAVGARISIIPIWLALATICFSTLVGILSGFYPARRAMKLSALEAIKTE